MRPIGTGTRRGAIAIGVAVGAASLAISAAELLIGPVVCYGPAVPFVVGIFASAVVAGIVWVLCWRWLRRRPADPWAYPRAAAIAVGALCGGLGSVVGTAVMWLTSGPLHDPFGSLFFALTVSMIDLQLPLMIIVGALVGGSRLVTLPARIVGR